MDNERWIANQLPDIWPTPRSVWIARQIVAGAPAWDGCFNYRVRDDSAGLNTDSGWLAAERVDPAAIGTGTANRFRIRFVIDEYNDKVASFVPTLYASRNSGAFAGEEFAVTGSSSYVQATLSSQYADNDACSTRLLNTYTPGNGAFETVGLADEVDGALASFSIAVKGAWVEVEFCLYFVDADVSDADTYDFRIYDSGAATDTYTATPQITVTQAGLDLVKVIDDRVNVDDTWEYTRHIAKVRDEDVNPKENQANAIVRSMVQNRIRDEACGPDEVFVRSMAQNRILDEQESIDDTWEYTRYVRRAISEVLNIDEADAVIAKTIVQVLSEVVDSVERTLFRRKRTAYAKKIVVFGY